MDYAYIFDFDGVLADSMPAHFKSYWLALEEFGVPIDKAQFYRQAGMTGREQIQYFAAKAGVSIDVDAVYRRKSQIHKRLADCTVPIACNVELFRLLKAAGARVAIASGSSRKSILPAIQPLGIDPDAIVTAEDVKRGKPHPDLFLLAAEKLGVSPQRCVVIEDSDAGIQCAQAAGMKVLRFYNVPEERPCCPEPRTDMVASNIAE